MLSPVIEGCFARSKSCVLFEGRIVIPEKIARVIRGRGLVDVTSELPEGTGVDL